jgi:inhibitor of KinA sporulation pathway (predicted exonuclease)
MLVHLPVFGVVSMPGEYPNHVNYHHARLAGTWANCGKLWQLAGIRGHKMDKKIPPHKEVAFQEINKQFSGNSVKEQCARLLQALRKFGVNTFEASRYLSIYDPRARICELRAEGYNIKTIWQTIEAENGVKHRVGCYVLSSGESHE